MNTRNIIFLIAVVIAVSGIVYYIGNQEASGPVTSTAAESPAPTLDEYGQPN